MKSLYSYVLKNCTRVFAFMGAGPRVYNNKIILLSGFFLVLLTNQVFATDRYVKPGGGCTGSPCYSTISDALAAASNGDVIHLESNISEGLVYINKSVTLDGHGFTLTSTGTPYGIEVAVSNATIQNLTLFDAPAIGIQVDCNSDNLTLTNVTVNSSGASGIGLNGSDNVTLTNITATNNVGNGLSITDCNNLTITGFTSSGNAFSPAFSAGIGLFTSGVYCPPAGISGFTLGGTVSIAEPVKVYSQKANANDVISIVTGAGIIDWAVGVGALNKSYWPDKATAYAAAAASYDLPFSYSNTLVYVEDVATGNFYVDDDPNGDASTPMLIQAAIDYLTAGKTVFLEDGAFNERITISKSLTLDGNGSLNSVLFGSGLTSGASGITINTGVTNVTIQDLSVTQYTGSTPNTSGGIYASGGNNNLTIKNSNISNNPNCSGIYIEGNANIDNVLIDNVKSFGHGAPGNPARGIVIWNGVKSNITIQNCEVYSNNCCGIELQDGSATGVTLKNNNVHDNSDSGISPIGLSGPGANLIENNTVTNNGRFGIEIKLPNGSGATSGAGSIVVQGNTVSRSVSIIPENRDIAGIAVYRRGALSAGNVNIPTGVVIQNNTVSGYNQPSTSDGFGIVVEGTNHIVQNNTVQNNNVGIQQQAGHTPYVENVGGGADDGNQNNLSDQYFGRGNTPFTCGNLITGNIFSGNTTDTRNVGAGVNTLAGVIVNTNNGETFCSIQTANDDSNTANGHTLTLEAGTYTENVSITKSLTILGPNANIDPNTGTRVTEAIVRPATVQTSLQGSTSGTIFRLGSASGHLDVTIKGLTIDGNNPTLSGGRTLNGVEIHTGAGIVNSIGSFDSNPGGRDVKMTIQNNIIKNLERYGVLADGVTPAVALAGTDVSHNKIDNLPSGNLFGGDRGRGIAFEENHYGSATYNVISRVNVGWQDDNYYLASPGAATLIDHNTISSYHRGIFHNLQYGSANNITISNNTVSAESSNNSGTDFGIELASIQQTVGATVTNNNVSGKKYGILLWNLPTSATIDVSGGTLSGNAYGVYATNYDPQFANGSTSNAKVSGLTITGSTIAGIFVDDNPSNSNNSDFTLTVDNDCEIVGTSQALTGILVSGSDAHAVVQNNDASIHGFAIGIDVDGGSATITGNHIYDNTIGIRFTNSGNGTVNNLNNFDGGASPDNGRDIQATATAGAVTATPNNSFAGDTYGVENLSATTIDASYCYWEDPNGPGPVGPIGAGAKITTKVLYCPWLNAAPPSGTPVGPVKNTTTLETFCTIQAAIDDANTVDGHTLEVSPGTYNEQLLVNKSLTIIGVGASQPVIDFTGTVSGKPALADVSKPGVTFDNLKFKVDLTKLSSAIIASATDIDNFAVKNSAVEAYGSSMAGSYGSYGNRNAISINYGGSIDYRVAAGGVDNVVVQNTTVSGVVNDGFGQSRYFRAAVALDEGGGSFTGNTFQTINHDILLRFPSNGNVTISNNNFNGGGVELSDINAGAGTLTVSNNTFDATFANVAASGAAVLRLKNNQQMKTTQLSGNTFSNHEWAVSLENYNSVTFDNNGFTPKSGSTTYHHIAVNTKSISSNSATIVQTTVAAVLTNNTFNGSGTPGGTALSFHNHDNDAAAFGVFTIGTPGNENNFNSGIATFIRLDDQTGTSSGATFPAYTSLIGSGAGALTTMACWVPDVNVQNNKFDVGAGLQLPSAMSYAQRTALETNLYHNPDNLCLGNLIYIYPVHNLTQNTYYVTIQEAIDAANANDVIECEEYTFLEKVNVTKTLTLKGVSEANTIIDGTGLGNGSGITIASGVTNVSIEKFTIKNHSGTDPNTYAGIYAPANNSGLNVQHCTLKDNVGGSGFYANGPINGLVLNDLDVSGHPNTFGAARGIVVWNGFKENITITNCDVYNNNCCGIELQDGTASGVTMTGNNVHDNGDNGIGLSGLKGGTGANLIANNTLTNNGRFGIEVKNPNGTGQTSGTGSIVVENNTVNFTASPTMNNRDHAGIAVFRRAFLTGNSAGYPNIPTGVVVRNNTVAGYQQQNPGSSEKGYGIVIEGTNHSVLNNTVNNSDFGIQEQGGLHPNANYVADDAGDGNQENGMSANYFGRGNAPVACGNTISGNTFSGNTTDINTVVGGSSYGLVVNTTTGETFCSIQAGIDDAQTVNSHTLTIAASTYPEAVNVNKSLTLRGPNYLISPNGGIRVAEASITGGLTVDNAASRTVTVEGLRFQGVTSPLSYNGNLAGTIAANLTFTKNLVESSSGQMAIFTGTATNTANATIQDNRFLAMSGNAMQLTASGAVQAQITDNTIDGAVTAGINTDGLTNSSISANTISNTGQQAIQVAGAAANVTVSANVITNANTSLGADRGGIRIYGSAFAGPVNITNNIISGSLNGVAVRNGENITGKAISVTDNNLSGNTKTLYNGGTGTLNASCNWHGTINAVTIAGLVTGPVNFSPYNINGTDISAAIGFQPDPLACTGTPVVINSVTPDHIICGETTGSLTVAFSGGTGPYDIAWTGGSATNITSPYVIASLAAGTYGITVTDSYGSYTTTSTAVNYLPVNNTTDGLYFATIQQAIDAATTGTNDVIEVCAGTYAEYVTVNKSVTLNGPNAAISPNTGTRVAEAVIVPPTTNTASGRVVLITASNVNFNGFTVNGDNASLPESGVGFGAPSNSSMDALHGISANANGLVNVNVSKNIVKNVAGTGIRTEQVTAYSGSGAPATYAYNNTISDNLVDNIMGSGISVRSNMYASVTDNVVTNALYGLSVTTMRIENKTPAASRVISGNSFQARQAGIWFNLCSATPYAVNNNTVTAYGDPTQEQWNGIMMATVSGAQNFMSQTNLPMAATPEYYTFSNNTIDGSGMNPATLGNGYWLYYVDNFRDNLGTDHYTTITGGSVSNVDRGLFMMNFATESPFNFSNPGSTSLGSHANVSGVSIAVKTGGTGIFLKDNAGWTTGNLAPLTAKRNVYLNLGAGVTVTGGAKGLLLDFPDPSTAGFTPYDAITGAAINTLVFTGQTGNYVEMLKYNRNLDATGTTFDGQTGATASLAQNFAIEDKIVHKIDNSALGFVLVKANNDFVTANSFSTPNTTPSIQRGVDAASAGFTVNVGAGTFVEDVNVNKQLTLLGSGYLNTTVSGPMGGSGSTFEMNAAGIVFDGFNVTREGNNTTDWNNNLNTAGISIQGQTNTAEIRNSRFTGNRTGIDVNNSNGNNIHNNIITFNRTGLIFRNQTDNTNLTENDITDNWTAGVLFLDGSGGSNSPVQQAINSTFNNNNISGNWYGQIVDRQSGGSLPTPGTLLKNFDCNWYGTTAPVVSTANSTEPGYSAQIPVAYGGSAAAPGGQPDILGPASANFDYVSWLVDGTDNQPATIGFQPVPSMCLGTPVVITLTQQTNVSCFGGSNGALDITPSGGSGNYGYLWSTTATTQDISGLAMGAYSVTVTDLTYLGTATATYTITEPTALTATAGNNGPIYAGATLNLTATPAGGTAAYTYNWTGPNSFASTDQNPSILNVTVAANGVYSVTVTDMNGCMTVTSTTALIYGASLYVNDNSLAGDHYTTAVGSNSNPGTPAAPFATLSYAISIAQPGNTIYVDAGTYVENPTVNKSLTILGSNAGVSGTGARTYSESTVQTNGNQNAVFTVAASSVTIDGFFIEGNDPLVTGAPVQSGDDANVYYNILTASGNGHTFSNNILKHAAIGVRGDHASNGNLIDNNWFDAIGVFDFGYAVTLRTNYYADVTNNKMTRVWTGLHTNNHNGAGGPASWSFSGNQVSSYAGGLWYNQQYNSATPLTVNNNQFSAETGAVANNYGVQFVSIQDAVNPVFTNNTITGTDYGFIGWNLSTSNTVTLGATNTITGAKKAGIYFTNNLAFNPVGTTVFGAGAAASTLNVAGIGISPAATGTGIVLEGTGAGTTTLNFIAPTTLNGGATGLSATGSAVAITGNTLANLTFTGQTGDYITLSNNAFTGQQLDATATLFDGTAGSGKTNAQLFATEDKITHRIEDKNLGFVLVKAANIHVTDIATAAATNNDYTRIRNAVETAANNWTINLKGTFDWTETNASASWALGNDGIVSAADDYSILVPANLNGVTLTAPDGLGTASIQGPGDLAAANLEGVLVFDGGDNQNWTISNLDFLDFDLTIGMFNGAGGTDAFNGTTITNNHIRIATDLNTVVAPADVNQNIGIHYSFGANQTISNNVIDIPGNGVSNGANYSTSAGMQSNTSGGNVYNGLQITGNTINILNPQSANPEVVLGIWENAHAHSSNITVSNNQFLNLTGDNNATNLQRAFRVTSHSSGSTTVTYSGNTVRGANIGFQWLAASNFAGNQPIVVTNNTLNNNAIGFLVQSNGLATFTGNDFDDATDNTVDLQIQAGSVVTSGGGNQWAGNKYYVENLSSSPLDIIGETYDESNNFRRSDRIYDALDNAASGLVRFFATDHYVSTPGTGSADETIQRAVNAASAGHTIYVEAGTYAENVTVNKDLTLLGPNTGINPNTGTRVAEAIVVPASSNLSNGRVFDLTADGITIDGFTVDGDNPLVSGGTSLNGADINATAGIASGTYSGTDGNNNLLITNNILKNFDNDLSSTAAIYGNGSQTVAKTGNVISNNKIDNSNIWAIIAEANFYADITGNVITKANRGIQTDGFWLAGSPVSISNNTISYYKRGITLNNYWGTTSAFTVSNNTIQPEASGTNEDGGTGAATPNRGIAVWSMYNTVGGVSLVDNAITGAYYGEELWNNAIGKVTQTGGTITNANVGIYLPTNQSSWGNAGYGSNASVSAVTITNPTTDGIYLLDNSTGAGASIDFALANAFVSGGVNGIHAEGDEIATEIHNNSITGYSAKAIDASAYTGATALDAECNWYGVTSASAVAAVMSGNVDYTTWLVSGTDDQPMTQGFQPVAGACEGEPISIAISEDPVTCGETEGSITVDFMGGTPPYTMSWSGTESGSMSGLAGPPQTISNLSPGAYTVTVTDTYGSSAMTSVTVDYLPVTNVTQTLYFATIQEAITYAVSGDVIQVCKGTYAENITVDKALTINGPMANMDADTRFAAFVSGPNGPKADPNVEAIITAPVNNPTGANPNANDLIRVKASGVTINGFVIDGNNPAIAGTSAIQTSGFDIDARRGITNVGADDGLNPVNNLQVKYNIIQNVAQRGISLANGGPVSTGNAITENVIRNFGSDPVNGGMAVILFTNAYADITNNTIDVSDNNIGLHLQNFYSNGLMNWTGNTVTVGQDAFGMHANLFYASSATLTIANNTINARTGVTGTSDYTWGINVWSVQVGSTVAMNNNIIGATGGQFGRGINLWNLPTSNTVSVSGGTVGNSVVGINLDNIDIYYGGGSNTVASVSGVSISNTTVGLRARAEVLPVAPFYAANTVTGNVTLNVSGVTVDGGTHGIQAIAPAASAPFTAAVVVNNDSEVKNATVAGILASGGQASATVQNNDASIFGNPIGIDVDGGTATVQNNHIYDNGIGVRFTNGGTGTVNNGNNFDGGAGDDNGTDIQLTASAGTVLASPNNSFAGDTYGVQNGTAATVNATLCYWESATGPGPVGPGSGANVTSLVNYCPWLDAPNGTPFTPTVTILVDDASGNTPDDGIICIGDAVSLDATTAGATAYAWDNALPATAMQNGLMPAISTTYNVTVTVPGCSITDAQLVQVDPLPSTTITADAVVCGNSTGNVASVPNAGMGATYSWSITNGTITAGAGTNSVTYTAGMSGSVTFNVTVTSPSNCTATGSLIVPIDNTAPTITCVAPVTTNTDLNLCTAVVNGIAPASANDACPYTITYAITGTTTGSGVNDASGSTFNKGLSTVTYTIVDASGNSANCSFNVTVNDAQQPTISCPATAMVDILDPRDPYATGWATGADNCGTVTITYNDDRSGLTNCNATGNIVRTFTATDASGNIKTCQQTITVQDNTDPVLSACPTNITVNVDPMSCTAVVTYTDPTAVDQGYFQGFENAAYASGTYPNAPSTDWNEFNSKITRAASGTDGINSKTGAAHGVINSTVLPAPPNDDTGAFNRLGGYSAVFGTGFRSAQDIYINLSDPAVVANTYGWDLSTAASNQSNGHLRDFIFHAASNASGEVLIGSSNNTNGTRRNDLASINHYTITSSGWYTFEWVFRNNGSGVLAVDLNLRNSSGTLLWTNTLSNPTDLIATNVGGNRYMWFTFLEVNKLAIDNSTLERNATVACAAPSGSAFNLGTTSVTCTATDACLNTSTCSFNVTVVDNIPPAITCPSNIVASAATGTCGAVVTYTAPVGTDNCMGPVTTQTDITGLSSGSTFPVGTTTLQYTVVDGAMLSSNCQFTVTVNDGEQPTISCPPTATLDILDPRDPYATGWATGADNCGTVTITYNDDRSGLTNCNATGNIVRTFTATDASGNIKTCQQTVTIQDNTDPELSPCPTDIVVNADPNACSVTVNYTDPTAVDVGYFQGFENADYASGTYPNAPSTDWNEYNSKITRAASGTDGITSGSGAAHGVINSTVLPASPDDNTGAFNRLGGYSAVFGTGFRSSQDIYIDLSNPAVMANTYGWDLSTAVNNQSNNHLRDFVFHAASNASGEVLIGSSNGSNFTRRNDLASINHYTITSSGWYTFEWVFRNNAGVLAVDLNLRNSGGTLLWTNTLSTPSDLIATNVGGNRYMWFTFLEVNKLAIDNSTLERNANVACVMPSGSTFNVGTTSVTCTATDACTNTSTCSFNVTVNPVDVPAVSITASANPICAGTNVTFTATPTFGGATPSYQWYLNAMPVGTNSPMYSNNSLANGDQVYCVMTTSYACPTMPTATSNTVTMTVNPLPSAPTTTGTSCSGVAANFDLQAHMNSMGNGVNSNYSWYALTNNPLVTGESLTPQTGDLISDVLVNNTSLPQTVIYRVTPTSDPEGCLGSFFDVILTVNPIPTASTTDNNDPFCSGGTTNIVVSNPNNVAGTTYNWSVPATAGITELASAAGANGVALNVPIAQTLTNTTGSPITVTFTVTPVGPAPTYCTGTPVTQTVTVNPTPKGTVTASASPICTGMSVDLIYTPTAGVGPYDIVVNGVTYTNITSGVFATFSPLTTTTYTLTSITDKGVTPNCSNSSPASAVTVTVNPTPDAVATPSAQTICSGASITTIALTGSVMGTTFNWTRDNTADVTGIAAMGSGNISGSLTNTTNAAITVTFTITPVTAFCTGTPITATVVVNPTPTVDDPTDQVVCNNASTTAVTFTGAVAGHMLR